LLGYITLMVSGIIMEQMGLMGALGLALGGSILFFALSFVINQAQVPNVNILLLAGLMSSFAFVGFLLIGLGLYFIFKSGSQRPNQS